MSHKFKSLLYFACFIIAAAFYDATASEEMKKNNEATVVNLEVKDLAKAPTADALFADESENE